MDHECNKYDIDSGQSLLQLWGRLLVYNKLTVQMVTETLSARAFIFYRHLAFTYFE